MHDPIRIQNANSRAEVAAAASQAWERAGDRKLPFPTAEPVAVVLQSEYDRHMQRYRNGCRGSFFSANAVRDVASRLGVSLNLTAAEKPTNDG